MDVWRGLLMTDYVLKYQVWNGEENGKQATFRSEVDARKFLADIRHTFPQAFIYVEGQGQLV